MAKKPAKTSQLASESSGAGTPKTPVSRAKKHIKAQALGVAAAVEEFVSSMTQATAEPEEKKIATPENSHSTADLTPVAAPVSQLGQSESAAPAPVTHHQIATLAYRYYESRKGQAGSPAEDWLRAEKALKAGA